MAAVLLDTSALLAGLFEEPGSEQVAGALKGGAAMSAVNLAELAARLHQDGWPAGDISHVVDDLGIDMVPFERDAALLSGQFRSATRQLGLGLGDRACLATASMLDVPALTADRAWKRLKLRGVKIQCIR